MDNENLINAFGRTLTGNLIPDADDTYDLGSAIKRWKDLYLMGSSLHLGSIALEDENGCLGTDDFHAHGKAGVSGYLKLHHGTTPSAHKEADHCILWIDNNDVLYVEKADGTDVEVEVSTKVETLTYTSGTPGAGEFTHSLTQEASIGNAVIDDITVVKRNIGGGQAYSKVFVNVSYLQQDASFSITLAPNTLTTAFINNMRAFRPTLNVVAYVRAGWTSADVLYMDRDNNITGDSPCYFMIEGLGTY